MVKLLSATAPAKLNLFLRVTGRRADGYHELDSVFIPINICDRLTIELRESRESRPSVAIVTLRGALGGLPADANNLAVRAAVAFMDECALIGAITIELDKHIPVGAGMGGGSSDAAAVLRMLAVLYRLADTVENHARLARIALKLGADVPFFLDPRIARVRGIGERITPVTSSHRLDLVIVAPPVEVATAEVFRALRSTDWSGAADDRMVTALLERGPIVASEILPQLMVNDLATVATARWPIIGHLCAKLTAMGALGAAMTGSGGAVFGVFPSATAAAAAAAKLAAADPTLRVFVAESLDQQSK